MRGGGGGAKPEGPGVATGTLTVLRAGTGGSLATTWAAAGGALLALRGGDHAKQQEGRRPKH